MMAFSKIFLGVSAIILIADGIKTILGMPNFVNPDWPFPCPLNMIVLGLGIVLFVISGGTHKHK